MVAVVFNHEVKNITRPASPDFQPGIFYPATSIIEQKFIHLQPFFYLHKIQKQKA